jgi:hypothetical protein
MEDTHGTYLWRTCSIITPFQVAGSKLATVLQVFRDMGLSQDERLSGYSDDPLVRTAGCARRQLPFDFGGNVSPNNGEVAVFKLEDIRAAMQRRRFCAAQMWVGTNSA